MVELTHTSCVLVGDIHGETQSLLDDFEREDIIITDTDLVLLGDIGLGFHYYSYRDMDWIPNDDVETLKILEDWCEKYFNDVWVLRGNHDDPKKFNDDFFSNFKHIHYLKDGEEVIGKNGKHYLTVPGAISVDRVYRRENVSYWIDDKYIPRNKFEVLKSIVNFSDCVYCAKLIEICECYEQHLK